MSKIYLDTNIFIDIIEKRSGIKETALAGLYNKFDSTEIYISVLTVHIAFYILKIKPNSETYKKIKKLLDSMTIVPLTKIIIHRSINTFSKDFEDTLQYYSALDSDCNYILTRDIKDFIKIKKDIPSNIQILDTLEKII